MQVERYYLLTRDDGLAGLCLLDALKASDTVQLALDQHGTTISIDASCGLKCGQDRRS
jgi:hypothetical protein